VRTDGHFDGPAPRWIELTLAAPGRQRSWGGWCRQEVWTPLDERAPTPFVLAETWSRLGSRAPRRIDSVRDAVWNGPLARIRPLPDGTVDFVVELFEGRVEQGTERAWHGATIRLPAPRQRSYRFEGSIPAGRSGPVARWGDLEISILDSAAGSGAALVRNRFAHGFVAGASPSAEYEERTWEPADPVERSYDGVDQALFRLRPTRKAAGFRDGTSFGEGVGLDD
jgi:hypothetical protein